MARRMTPPKISVITAVYNAEGFLAETIRSVLNQTFKDFEYIIVNDGSVDSSLDIIRNFMAEDDRIVLINHKRNLGSVSSRNAALKKAEGQYIAVLDHDDLAFPERLQKQYDFLETHEDIFLVGGGAINIDENGKLIGKSRPETDPIKLARLLPKKNQFYHPTIMFRNIGDLFYREKIFFADEYDFYLRLLLEGKMLVNLRSPVIYYRIYRTSASRKNYSRAKLFAEMAQRFYFQRLKNGTDEYDSFDPQDILRLDPRRSTSKKILRFETRAAFKINDFKALREYYTKYLRIHGLDSLLLFYLLSFFPKSWVDSFRRLSVF